MSSAPLTLADTTVVFDLDGTLVDTAPDLARAANAVMAELDRPALSVAELRPYVGQGARATLRHAVAETGGGVDEDALSPLVERFVAIYRAGIADESRPYPGVLDAMDRLEGAGANFGICTNKREDGALLLLKELDLLDRFVAVVGGDTLPTRKPEPESLAETLARAGSRPFGVMIGDTAADTGAAQALGIPCIAVSFGYSPVPVATLGADAVIDGYEDLVPAVTTLLTRARAAER